ELISRREHATARSAEPVAITRVSPSVRHCGADDIEAVEASEMKFVDAGSRTVDAPALQVARNAWCIVVRAVRDPAHFNGDDDVVRRREEFQVARIGDSDFGARGNELHAIER